MTCLTCKSLDLQQHKDMSKIGYGRCEITGNFNSVTAPKCEKFIALADDLAGKRVDWVKNAKGIK